MKIKKSLLLFLGLMFLGSFVSQSCNNRDDTVSCFPTQNVNVQINTLLPAYANDLINKGWTYINEQQSGTRGLILVKLGDKFKVYDRNAPHICPTAKSTLEVRNDTTIFCPEDGAEWILRDGTPTKISGLPPKTYLHNYDASTGILSIYY